MEQSLCSEICLCCVRVMLSLQGMGSPALGFQWQVQGLRWQIKHTCGTEEIFFSEEHVLWMDLRD